jgi:hypothetical protein
MHALARNVLVYAVYVLAPCSGALAASSSAEAQEAYLIHVHRQPSILGTVGQPLVSREVCDPPLLPEKGNASARALAPGGKGPSLTLFDVQDRQPTLTLQTPSG